MNILFIIAVLPVVLIGLFIHKKDQNKEPKKLLVKLFLGGIGACILTIIITILLEIFFPFFRLDTDTLSTFELIIYVFVGIALIEELCKWIMAYRISYYDNDFDELYDMILYCIFVSLGFACVENILYVYQSGIGTGIMRGLLAVPGHACDGFFMGYYLGLSKICEVNNQKVLKIKYIILSIIIPVILHGIYDYCLFKGEIIYLVIFLVFVICTYIYTIIKIRKVSKNNIRFKY